MSKHILIYGRRRAGKSTLVKRLLEEITVPVSGFRTRSTERDESGYHSIYLYPATGETSARTEENHIGDCNGRQRTVHPEVFDRLGVQYLDAVDPEGIILMDELGFMEERADAFRGKVLAALDGEIPVFAAVKDSTIQSDFLDTVTKHPNAEVFAITEENREELYETLLPVVRSWNRSASGTEE